MNICRKFVFREILNEVRPVELRGEAIPALFFFKSCWWVSQKWKLMWRSGLVFWPLSSSFVFFSKNRRKFVLVNLKGYRMRPSNMAC